MPFEEVYMKLLLIPVAIVASLLGVSCSPKTLSRTESKLARTSGGEVVKPAPLIIGKWLTPTGGSIEFKADGSATMAGPNGSAELSYRLPNERTIEMTKPGGKSAIHWDILSVTAQEMVVKDSDGKEVRLRRGG
jgi:hypothetical protein